MFMAADISKPGDISQRGGMEIPLPEEHFRKLGIASRPTFWRWEAQGLRILRVNNRRFIYPSDLTEFLEKKDQEANAKG